MAGPFVDRNDSAMTDDRSENSVNLLKPLDDSMSHNLGRGRR